MPRLRFESITDSLMRLPDVIKSIPDVLRNPAANPMQAAILLSIAILLVIIALLSVVLLIMRPSLEDEDSVGTGGDESEEEGEAGTLVGLGRRIGPLTVSISLGILVIAGVWVAAGITTSSPEVCNSCHTDTVHAATRAEDPHAKVSCVDCHETGGPIAHVTVGVVTRLQHVMLARSNQYLAAAYGKPVASDGCMRCHRRQIRGTSFNPTQSLRVSHKEPLAVGAQCVDCHVPSSGVIDARTVGMSSCLRCHDGTIAKADCSVCHVGDDPSAAIRATVATDAMAAVQVPNPQCDGCHFDMTECNACHGISMPHSADFKQYGHARPAAIDIWSNGGKTCVKCHYPGHNSCQQPGCHLGQFPSHPSPVWRTLHQNAKWSSAQTACLCHHWNPYDHNGVVFCQVCHAVKPKRAAP